MADIFAHAREQMIKNDLLARGITDEHVLDAMRHVRREEFVPPEYQGQAYWDGPLPIGQNQTISQPYIVALMTQELKVNSNCEVLELGTGSGYQTAVLSKLAKKVYSIERFEPLSLSAQAVLGKNGITNVEFAVGDGSCGWPGERKFDRIIATAAVPEIPEQLKEQLNDGGILIAPVEDAWMQNLMVFEKHGNEFKRSFICAVRFVRMVGKCGFEESQQ